MIANPLGQKTVYGSEYDKSLLFAIRRSENREAALIDPNCFDGYDLWNGYELSWLDLDGKPQVRRLQIVYSALSRSIVESKSLKLYLGSFAMTRFKNAGDVKERIQSDLEAILDTPFIKVKLFYWDGHFKQAKIKRKHLLDAQHIACSVYLPEPALLEFVGQTRPVRKHHISNLLKTNCPVTGQPDWGTVMISYRSRTVVTEESLLKYIVSYRLHNDFHESCCEKIFTDLHRLLQPKELVVKCFYTRRGGLDINPCRFYGVTPDKDYNRHFWRQ